MAGVLVARLVRQHCAGHCAQLVQAARCLSTVVPCQAARLSAVPSVACMCNSAAAQQQQPSYSAAAQWTSYRTFFSQFMKPDSKVYKERRLIGYSPEQLYEVVSSVQHYHQFVPWCVGSNVLKRTADGSYLEAELSIGFQMISERYTSRVKLQAPTMVSSTVADSALFHHLESVWQLTPGPNPNATWLSFSVDFAFLNPLYANVAQLFFSEVVTCMMGAFEGRCKQLYGPPCFSPAGQKQLHQQHYQQQQQHSLRHHKHHHHPIQQVPAAAGKQAPLLQHAGAAAGEEAAGEEAAADDGAGAAGAVPQQGSRQQQQLTRQQRWREEQ